MSGVTRGAPPPVSAARRAAGWAVHLYTASGVLFALLAVLETCSATPDPRWVFIWLTVAVLIDSTDGPMARAVRIKEVVPRIDGRTIDDIVDFLTFTFVPLLLVVRMEWVPQPALLFVAAPLLASLLGFANTGAKDEQGGFFLGFPSYWNVAVFYLGILATWVGPVPNAVLLLLLAILTVAPVGFIYPNLAPRRLRPLVIGGAVVWLVVLLAMLPSYPRPPVWLFIVSTVYPVFYTLLSLSEYTRYRRGLGCTD
jgi:phosphatidylcholine synthase